MDLESIPINTLKQVAFSGITLFIAAVLRWIISRLINRHIKKNKFEVSRRLYLVKVINLFITILAGGILVLIWSVKVNELTTFLTAFFTVIGVALFAQWSILSNITASFILFFNFPFKVGSKIRIIDGDNTVAGIITDITLFSIRIMNDQGEHIAYPNSLALQKPIHTIDDD